MRIRLVLLALITFASPANAADRKLSRRERGDLAIQARAILNQYCSHCHGKDGAPSTLSVIDHAQLVHGKPPVPFVNLEDPSHSQVIEFIEDGSMPPGGRPRPTTEEVKILKAWVAAKAPSYPRAFDDRTTLAVMLEDLENQNDTDVPYLRYLSLAHLVSEKGFELSSISQAERKLQIALLNASGRPVAPEPVDDTATLFRFDIRKPGWDAQDLFDRMDVEKRKADGVYPIVPFDLILNEYPFTVALAEKDPLAEKLAAFFMAAKQLKPVPFVRADWLSEVLGKDMPLASDMKSLVTLVESIEKMAPKPAGPKLQPFGGPKDGEPAKPTPLTAWYGVDSVPDPYGIKIEIDNAKSSNEVFAGDPFKLKLSAERDIRFTLLHLTADGDLRIQPVAGGNVLRKATGARLLGPNSTAGNAFDISITSGNDTAREYFIFIASDLDVPIPTVIRSKHSDDLVLAAKGNTPVWRFLFDQRRDVNPTPQMKAFDTSKAVRKIVPITVKKKPE